MNEIDALIVRFGCLIAAMHAELDRAREEIALLRKQIDENRQEDQK